MSAHIKSACSCLTVADHYHFSDPMHIRALAFRVRTGRRVGVKDSGSVTIRLMTTEQVVLAPGRAVGLGRLGRSVRSSDLKVGLLLRPEPKAGVPNRAEQLAGHGGRNTQPGSTLM